MLCIDYTSLSWAIPDYWTEELRMHFPKERMGAAENNVFIIILQGYDGSCG